MKNNFGKIKSIKEADLKGKRVILRVDFNVPVKNGRVLNDFKIVQSLPTINYLLKRGCFVVLISHFGRPSGKKNKEMSLEPVFKTLKKLFGAKIKFEKGRVDDRLVKKIGKIDRGSVLLENIRFDGGEDRNSDKFSGLLAKLGDIFVNESFAASHRSSASTVGLAKRLPSFAGLNFFDEVKFLSKALNPKKPAVALIGGAKVSTKFHVIENFLQIYNQVMLGGGLANTFLSAKGYAVGDSLVEKSKFKEARRLLASKKLLLPLDVVVTDKKTRSLARVVPVGKNKGLCSSNEEIVDIGPETIIRYARLIRKAKTIVWGGPAGIFELPKFRHGTLALARIIGARASGRALGIAGGGETLYAIHLSKMGRYYDFISTGGGAMLDFLAGKKLPAIEALKK